MAQHAYGSCGFQHKIEAAWKNYRTRRKEKSRRSGASIYMASAGSHWIVRHDRRGLGRRRSPFAPAGSLGGRVTCCRRTIGACAVQDEANYKQDSDNSGHDVAARLGMIAHVITRRDTSV